MFIEWDDAALLLELETSRISLGYTSGRRMMCDTVYSENREAQADYADADNRTVQKAALLPELKGKGEAIES